MHFQGYLRYRAQVAFSRVVTLLRKSHVEITKGNEEHNIKYCTKEESRVAGPWSFGEPAKAGKRNDLTLVREMIAQGKGMREIVQQASSYQSMRSVLSLLL